MKKIGIDARLYGQTGVGRYIKNLIYYLQEEENFLFYIYISSLHKKELGYLPENFIIRENNSPWHSVREQTDCLLMLLQDSLDLMHFTYFSYPFFYRKPFIITLHDLTPYFFKTGKASTRAKYLYDLKHFFYRILVKNAVLRAQAIITPSQAVKNDIVKMFGTAVDKKIHPIYEGVDRELLAAQENRRLRSQFTRPFFLYVCNFYPHKNVEMLIQVFSQITQYDLVLVGKRDFFARRIEQSVKKTGRNNVRFFFDARDEDLVFFYKHAQALINPSLSEGFGLPLIEAAYFNCPIIASHIPVFNEILMGKFIKINPKSPDNLEQAIRTFNKEKYILLAPPDYSFKKMAEETYLLYKQILYERNAQE